MQEIKLNLIPNLLRLFRYLSAIILNYFNQFRKRSNVYHTVLIPAYVNQKFKNIQTLMNEVERTEELRTSQLLKDI
ncbi:hypothetical protein OTSTA716_1252 [Orientia tsutsugamushi str. TA716]|uniref:Uncharacterized protein n=1 Tax=Orientia tsutsugamushi str. TA716 TaxID=1359175 RepID=A0A0F3P2N6_ORITS|nr:hypothetical protein OTSTA716_1252 [Orientia tsutsugamushi str. TA716]